MMVYIRMVTKQTGDTNMKTSNVLLSDWNTPYQIPPFGCINDSDFETAFDFAMNEHLDEVADIANAQTEPTFENTIEALELAGSTLSKVSGVFFNLSGAHTNAKLQETERKIAPAMSAHFSRIQMNEQLFKRIGRLFSERENLDLDHEQMRLLERVHSGFVRSGAKLEGEARTRMSEIGQRLATLGTKFSQNVLADEAAYELVLEEDDLTGLPSFLRSASSAAAVERGHDGKYVITLSRSLVEPFLQFSDRRDLREQAFKAWISRGEQDGETDNRPVITEILKLREERAQLLGFDNFAQFKLDDQMAKTPDAVRELLMNVWQPAKLQAGKETAELQELANSLGSNVELEPWDWRYYSEKLRKQQHDLDEAEIKPYFQLDKMIEAAFETARRLFGLSFQEVDNLQLYHRDVRAFDVMDREGNHVALFLGDYFARPSKRSGAWMSGFRSQQKLAGDIRPVIVNVMNFARAADGEPTLLTYDDARTLFHEFGHALHGMLSDVTYESLAGTSVARDFVELPSQLFEHWLGEPEILTEYALHADTGEPMPEQLLEKLKGAENFNQGFATVEYTASALVDLEYHTMPADDVSDVIAAENALLDKIGMPRQITMRHRSTHFAHVFSGDGYSAGYYSYMWSEVMDADAFQAFKETGNSFDEETAANLKEFIYSAGASRDPAELYVAFRGSMPSIDALLEGRGLKDVA